jgi:phage terminase large subunit-like protein
MPPARHRHHGAELDAELIEDDPGALWSRSLIERSRIAPSKAPRWFDRVVTAIDPSLSIGPDSDEGGLVTCGLDRARNEALVIEDLSMGASPERWARAALDLHLRHLGDAIVYEANVGGRLVESVLRQFDRDVRIRAIHAKKGKQARAEPVLALYEQGRVKHVGSFPQLEDEMAGWEPDTGMASPNRLDAMVYCITEIILRRRSTILDSYRRTSPRVIPIFAR